MRERGILFKGRLVRRILADAKTQTRRLVRIDDTPISKADFDAMKYQRGIPTNAQNVRMLGYLKCDAPPGSHAVSSRVLSPYGLADDRLYVREAWRTVESLDTLSPTQLAASVPVRYEADDVIRGKFREPVGRYRHARFMPRWASRINLEVTEVRVQRLQDITPDDVIAEGVDPTECNHSELVRTFAALWKSVNGPDSWDANPWVWAVSFKRVEAQLR